jgi:hypothetical protein
MAEDATFHLCLTHDVEQVYKRFGAIYGTLRDRNPRHLKALLPGTEPYWRFEDVMAIEDDLGVRSAFYFLNEQRLRNRPVREWLSARSWQLYGDRYSVSDPDIADVIRRLDSGGWEVGLHGSYESYREPQRLRAEKGKLEAILGGKVVGGRQHYLNLDVPDTWEMQADVGLRYDASLGSSKTYGFDHGYTPLRPFDDEFVVFPLTVMELPLPNVERRPNRAWRVCKRLLEEARENGAAMTVLWHPRFFYENDFPNYGSLYRRLIERALELGAWVGPPGELHEQLDHTAGAEMGPNK